MTGLLVVAGMVFDFGLARADRLTNKGYTDSAAAAGVRSLDGGDGTAKPFRGGCTALSYLRVSDPDLATMTGGWTHGDGSGVASDPCITGSVLQNDTCVANNTATWAQYHGAVTMSNGKALTVDIKTGYITPDPAFDPVGSADNGVTAMGGCDQLAVIIQESNQPGLGRIATSSNIVTKVRSVGRMTISNALEASAALLILERTDCTAISVNSNNTFIEVKGFGPAPGVIHSDSNGSGPGCAPANPAIMGKFATPPGISARQSETGTPRLPGQITTVAASGAAGSVPANASDGNTKVCAEAALPLVNSTTPATSCAAASGRALVGRGVVDKRYNASPSTGVQAAMAAAAIEYNKVPTGPVNAEVLTGYTVVGGSAANCSNVTQTNYTQTGAIFVDCPNGVNYKDFTFTNATSVVFNGDVNVNSTQTLSMPNVTSLYVKGSTATGGGLSSSGTLKVNSGTSALCSGRTAAASARIVVGTGAFTGGAQSTFELCQTTVLMANAPTQASCPVPPLPVVPGLAPADNPCGGYINLNGGGAMDWSAPNHVAGGASQSDWNNLEDLGLWTEASHTSSVGGGSSMAITGVFFLPNANPFIISGHGNQTIAANAQFVARKLSVQGQGTLYMRPDPNDSFTLPLTQATFNLVR